MLRYSSVSMPTFPFFVKIFSSPPMISMLTMIMSASLVFDRGGRELWTEGGVEVGKDKGVGEEGRTGGGGGWG